MLTSTNRQAGIFERFAISLTKLSGKTASFLFAVTLVLVWALSGPAFNYSGEWQLVINTSTTILTFLMVFLIQRSQNKDSLAIQLKLNEIIASINGASNRIIDIEDLSEKELEIIKKHFIKLAKLCSTTTDILESHSIEEAEKRHFEKLSSEKK